MSAIRVKDLVAVLQAMAGDSEVYLEGCDCEGPASGECRAGKYIDDWDRTIDRVLLLRGDAPLTSPEG